MKENVVVLALVAAFGLTSVAWAGNVSKFYRANPMPNPGLTSTSVEVSLRASSGDLKADVDGLMAEGKFFLGFSAFDGPPADDREVIDFAKKIKASQVIRVSKYQSTVAGPSFSANSFSRFSSFGLFIPSNIDRYEQVVLFFAPAVHRGIGLAAKPLSSAEAKLLGTGKAMHVVSVVRGSPAFQADVLPDDFIMTIDGRSVYDPETMSAAVQAAFGKEVQIGLVRDGKSLTKTIMLSTDGSW